MLDTLIDGQVMLVDRTAYAFKTPVRGDIVLCYYPDEYYETQGLQYASRVKRVVAVGGDTYCQMGYWTQFRDKVKITKTPKATVNGNYMAEVCASRDGAFLVIQLFQFTRMSYEPVSDVLIFDGDDAKALSPLFA